MECGPERRLATKCHVTSESPAGHGFGDAALKLASKFRMRTRTADGHSVGGGWVTIPMRWQGAPDQASR